MWGPSLAEFSRSCRASKAMADLVLKTRIIICQCMRRLTNRTKFSSLLQVPLTSIASKCLLTWSPWPRPHTISPSIASQSIINSSRIKPSMEQRSEANITTSLSPRVRTQLRIPTSITAASLSLKAIARQLVMCPNNNKTNRIHKLMTNWKSGCLTSTRNSSTIKRAVNLTEDRLAFRSQVMKSRPETMVVTWLCIRKLAQAIVRISAARTPRRSIQAGLLQANLHQNTMT